MNQPKRYLITSALTYANGPLHIGHLAGANLTADIFARTMRNLGKEVLYVGGSDEHGAAITIKALKEGLTPRQIIDKYHAQFEEAFRRIGISFDIYHRTSEPIHHQTSQDFFRTLYRKGEFIEKETEQFYDPKAKMFLADRYIKGTCPKCGYEAAYGDQCEKCGSDLSPTELINPVSTLTGEKPVLRKTKHWYFPLNKHEVWLRQWINEGILDGKKVHDPRTWKNHVIGQCNSWLNEGLQARAMTRDLDWGVDVPPEIPGAEGKKLYVWMDAPIGYISASKQWAIDHGKSWERFWKDEGTALIHFIGKDNIVFHAIIFPALLKAEGSFILPANVPANQFLNLEGDKISTSRNWAIWLNDYLESMPGKEDVLRFYLTRIMPEQRDSEFTWKGYQEANETELVNNLGNFINRVLVLVNKYYGGEVPDFDPNVQLTSSAGEDQISFQDAELLLVFDKLQEMVNAIRRFEFRAALRTLMEISSMGNQFLQFNAPWQAYKTQPELAAAVLNTGIQIVTALSVAMEPFMPFSSAKLREMLRLPAVAGRGELQDILDALAEGRLLLEPGHQIGPARHLFERIPDEVIEAQRAKLVKTAPAQAAEYPPLKPQIQYDDFARLDVRTGTIVKAEKMKKADKLLVLEVDLGFERRTIVSGIAQQFKPEEIIGRRVLVLVNLAPRKLRGVESNGMILMAEDGEGRLHFVSADTDDGWPVS